MDVSRHISKTGDALPRCYLFEAVTTLLPRVQKTSALKEWAFAWPSGSDTRRPVEDLLAIVNQRGEGPALPSSYCCCSKKRASLVDQPLMISLTLDTSVVNRKGFVMTCIPSSSGWLSVILSSA